MKKVLLNIVALTSLTFVSYGQTSLDSNTTCEKSMLLQEGDYYDNFTNKNGVGYYVSTLPKIIIIDPENQKLSMSFFNEDCSDDNEFFKMEEFGPFSIWSMPGMTGMTRFKIEKSSNSKLRILGMNLIKENDYGYTPEQIILGNSFNINLSDYTKYTDSHTSNPSTSPSDLVAPDSNVVDMFYTFEASETTMSLEMIVDNPSIESALVVMELLSKDYDSYKVGESNRIYTLRNLEIGKKYNLRLEFGMPNSTPNQTTSTNIVNVVLKNSTVTGIDNVELPTNISLSPNPSKGSFVVSTSQKQKSNIEIFNVLGEKVLQLNDVESGSQIDSKLDAGVYLVKANLGNKILSNRLVIE